MQPPQDVRDQTIVIIGKTGSGKSRLVNLLQKKHQDAVGFAESSKSTYSITKHCGLYKFAQKSTDENVVTNYSVIDTMGLADPEKTDEELLDAMREFLSLEVNGIHWFILVISGAEKITPETGRVILKLMNSVGLNKSPQHVLVCITHADGWNERAKTAYQESLMRTDTFGSLTNNGPVGVFFSGVPDPSDMDTDRDREYALEKEAACRGNLLARLTYQTQKVLQKEIYSWRKEVKEEPQTFFQKNCNIL
jgi:GTP-binding protein EngB required for normal cell division